VRDLASFSHRSTEPPAFENAAMLNSETNLLRNDDLPMSYQSLVKFSDSVHAPLRTVQRKCPIPEIGRRKCAKSSTITQPSSSSSSSTNFIATQVLKQNFRAVRWSIAVKFSMSMMMRHRTAKVAELLKFSCNQNQSCSLHPILCEI